MSSLGKRLLTAVITAPGVIALLFFAKRDNFPWAVGLFLAISAALGTIEFCHLMKNYGIEVRAIPTALIAGIGFFIYSVFEAKYGYFIGSSMAGLAVFANLSRNGIRENLKAIFAAILGLVYVPGLLHYLYIIFVVESGIIHTINLLLIVWGYDSGAFAVGSLIGKHKIAPEVSPNKTAEGVLGGLVFAFIGASVSPMWVPYFKWLPHIGILALLVGTATQMGDLTESWLKRLVGAKDSGHLFPGHGGVLDRIDGLLLALPVFYFYYHFILDFL